MLTYRSMQAADMPGILKLWEENSGWGGITEQQFTDWYLDTPFGPCLTVVAVNEREEIVGQKVFMPREVWLQEKPYRVVRALAPIIADEARLPNMLDPAHPILALFRYGMQRAQQEGYAMIYTLPAKGWSVWLKAFYRFGLPDWKLAIYDCFRLALPTRQNDAPVSEAEWEVNELDILGPEWDHLNEDSTTAAFSKDRNWINWKYAGDRKLGFYRHRQPMGYLVIRKSDHLLLDAHAGCADDLQKIIHFLITGNAGITELETLTGMLTPFWEGFLKNCPFTKIDYSFVYGMLSLREEVEQLLEPANWNLFPGD